MGWVHQPRKWLQCFPKEAIVVSEVIEPAVVQWTLKGGSQPPLREVKHEPASDLSQAWLTIRSQRETHDCHRLQQQRPTY